MKTSVLVLGLLALLVSCAGAQRALDAGGQHGIQLLVGGLLGSGLWLLHPIGFVGAALAAVGGAAGALLFGRSVTIVAADGSPVSSAPGIPWGLLVLLALVGAAWFTRKRWTPRLAEFIKRRVLSDPN